MTNALLEGKGARTALITTRGMRDVLELRRSARASLYDLFQDAPAVLVPRHLRLEVTERMDAQGAVVEPLRIEELDDAVDFIKRHDVEAVAVCLLYSFLNDAHERAIGERLRAALPDLPVFLSSEVLPEIREFERTSTTAVCAYVGPDPRLVSRAPRGGGDRAWACPRRTSWAAAAACSPWPRGCACPRWPSSRARRRASSRRRSSAAGSGSTTCSRSTWAAPPPRRA